MSKSKKLKRRIILIAVLAAIVFLYYYIELPAINIHSGGVLGIHDPDCHPAGGRTAGTAVDKEIAGGWNFP